MNREQEVPRLFGTNGVRGVVNTRDMDCAFALRLGTAIGTFMDGAVLVGTDARTSNEMIKGACSAGIMSAGCDVIDLGVVPTPTVQFSVKNCDVGGGVVITASHNPPEFNGIKCIDPDGTEMSRENEERIEAIFHSQDFRRVDWDNIGNLSCNNAAVQEHIEGVLNAVDAEAISSSGLRIALDCGNGAGGNATPLLLEKLGVRYSTLNADPNGAFPGHDSEPTPENARDLVEFVGRGDFDLGILHDGDADRTIFVDENGSYMYGPFSSTTTSSGASVKTLPSGVTSRERTNVGCSVIPSLTSCRSSPPVCAVIVLGVRSIRSGSVSASAGWPP